MSNFFSKSPRIAKSIFRKSHHRDWLCLTKTNCLIQVLLEITISRNGFCHKHIDQDLGSVYFKESVCATFLFSTPWFLFSNPTNHHLVFFLLEMFNNIIQYQFDGNSNLVYTVIRKRQVTMWKIRKYDAVFVSLKIDKPSIK